MTSPFSVPSLVSSTLSPPPSSTLFPYTTLFRSDRAQVASDSTLFTLVTMASFVETGSDLYAHVLVSYFDQDPEVAGWLARSEEHTSELQSLTNLVCRLLLEKKKKNKHSCFNKIM